jgi:NADH-quinone oxidoreductase subunit H
VPRLRYDQLMDLGWKVMIPISLFWLLVIAAVKVGRWTYVGGAVVAGVLVFMLLSRALAVGRARLADEQDAASSRRSRER